MDRYEFNNAGASIYEFTWNYFCDYYIEMAKFSLDNETTKSTLCYVLTNILKLLQPFMPYVTDEIYSMLPVKEAEHIMITSYPKYDKNLIFNEEEQIVDDEIEFIKNFRNLKAENNMTKELKIMFDNDSNFDLIIKVLKLENNIIKEKLKIKSYKVFSKKIKATIFFEKLETEADKIAKEAQIKILQESIKRRENLLANENYINKAPAKIVEMDRVKLEEKKKKLEELKKN